ncbi:MAG: phospholipase D-like domain-containing protein [Prevotellaceae bacterium]|jgi:superfamily II DNA/RNA helicase|nr:phospholipase D-like domain-containing protein [Prevotellaceae bacterium]
MNSEHFITNSSDKSLSKIINGIMPKTNALDFLVGYFYFSGIEEIYQNIADKNMRILVGLEMDGELHNKTVEMDFLHRKTQSSIEEIRKTFYKPLVKIFAESDYFDKNKTQEAFKIYYEKIKNGTLEIRKTKEPCHAKMYIFSYGDEHSENGENLGNVITGSSNLTYNGLRGQNEINVRFKNNPEYKDAKQIFENLWKNATIIADKEHIQNFEDGVIKHIWYEKLPTPYLLYLRVLYEYFNIDTSRRIRTPCEITGKNHFIDLKYQIDAVRLAIDIIEKHNGVLVSDVVGLGKSIVAATVANNLNYRTIIIAPPHLLGQWNDYKTEFHLVAEVFSRGVIEKALKHYKEHTAENEKWLIIIDEAHNYRNEYTQDYGMLHELCQGNKVMLLTATPFNNQPSDIYSMLKLFQIPTKSTLQTVDNLGHTFRELIGRYKKMKKEQKGKKNPDLTEANEIASKIRAIIYPLYIRRSRLDLETIPDYKKDLKSQKISFPEVADPELLGYNLGDLTELYVSTLQQIAVKEDENQDYDDNNEEDIPNETTPENTFKAARYKPITYVKVNCKETVKKAVEDAGIDYNLFVGRQKNLAKFMRTLLVRRFESSQAAFKISLDNMLNYCINIKEWEQKRNAIPVFKKGFLPDAKALYESTEDVIDDTIEKLENRGMFEIKTEYINESFFTDLDADIQLLKALKEKWANISEDNDPKFNEFVKILSAQIKNDPKRKIVVFSQFADTVNYLEKQLKKTKLPVFAYTSSKANQNNKESIYKNFDAGCKTEEQQNNYKILIATDAISEGYNLHRAGAIFNYDIPYNPTRVIQRIGRINRINKKMFDKLFIYNYFPSEIGEAETRIKEISTLKMAMIHAIMGEDTKVLTKDEQLQNFFAEQYKTLISNDEQQSWDTAYRIEFDAVKNSPEMNEALHLPLRTQTRRRTSLPREGVLVFARKGKDFVFKIAETGNAPQDITPEEALSLLKTNSEEKPFKVSQNFENVYEEVKKSLFAANTESENERTKRDALDKIHVMIQVQKNDTEYLTDLKTAVEFDAISGYALRVINRLKPKEYAGLPEKINKDYIRKMLNTYDSVLQGIETLILTEEIESDAVDKEKDLFNTTTLKTE